ncbi:MAG: PEPxxWA-CTERM sorting domain-containing protein [Pseudomonadota bacterium]
MVPEPATWAMMITGFGLLGGAARRRRAHSAAFA